MNKSLESFCPRLRPGRVIPRGAQIIFETDNPYNQITLPMGLADLVLLCSGQFSIRQIMEKFYKRRGAVPFKSILNAIHILHQNGFFENGEELSLNAYLQSWMEPRPSRQWSLSWRFGQRIVADKKAPAIFYLTTLIVLIISFIGFQAFPLNPFTLISAVFSEQTPEWVLASLFIGGSFIQTARHLVRGCQMLLLTGKAYNVAARLSPWGLHLHVGDESNDLFESQLYASMFHLSQITVGWAVVFLTSPFLDDSSFRILVLVNMIISAWELNPFVQSEGLKLIRALMFNTDREVVSWHYNSNSIFRALGDGYTRQDQKFARVCAAWGGSWLISALVLLAKSAAVFSLSVFAAIQIGNTSSVFAAVAIVTWFVALYLIAQSFVEAVGSSIFKPLWQRIKLSISEYRLRQKFTLSPIDVLPRIQELPFFTHFSEDQLSRILAQTEVTEVPTGVDVLLPGEESLEFYVLLEGEIEITHHKGQPSEWTSRMKPTAIFGETALLKDAPQMSQVRTVKRSLVLELPVKNVRQAALECHAIGELQNFRNAILVNQYFASSEVFRSLSANSIDFLSSRGSIELCSEKQVIFTQGDTGDCIYLILHGSVEILVHNIVVAQANTGNFFGEISLIANIPRTATVRALEDSVFFRISADSFWEVLVQNLDLGVFIETISERRLKEDLELAPALLPTGTDS